jgi:hypothetical protein
VHQLFGFDFAVEYRPSRLKTVANVLSRPDTATAAANALSGPTFNLLDDIRTVTATSDNTCRLRGAHPRASSMGRAFLSLSTPTYTTRCSLAHTAGHEGTQKTLQ